MSLVRRSAPDTHFGAQCTEQSDTHGHWRECGESKGNVGPSRDWKIRVMCNERALICCQGNARFHIKEDFGKMRSYGAEDP